MILRTWSQLRHSPRTRHHSRISKTEIHHTRHVLTFNLVFFWASNSIGKSRKVQKADWMQRWWFWGLGHNFDALDARGIGRAWTKRVFITVAMFSPSIWYFSGLLTPSESLERPKKLIECSDDDFEEIKNCHMKLKSLEGSHSTSGNWWLLIKISCNNSRWKPSNSIFGDGKNELFYPPGSSPLRRSRRTRHRSSVSNTGIYHTRHVLTFNLVFFWASNSLGKSRTAQKAVWMQRWWFWGLWYGLAPRAAPASSILNEGFSH